SGAITGDEFWRVGFATPKKKFSENITGDDFHFWPSKPHRRAKMANFGQGVCGLLHGTPGDPRKVGLWHSTAQSNVAGMSVAGGSGNAGVEEGFGFWHEAAVCRGATSGRVLEMLRTLGAPWPDRPPLPSRPGEFHPEPPHRSGL